MALFELVLGDYGALLQSTEADPDALPARLGERWEAELAFDSTGALRATRLKPPPRHVMETYWKGVLLVPERELHVARVDGTIAGSAQLQRPPKNNEAQALTGQLTTFFLAPWARGHGLAQRLVESVETAARAAGLRVLNLDVRATQSAAMQVYKRRGYQRWGTHPHYAWVDGRWITGYFYFKDLVGNGATVPDES